jgi:chromosome segregation ATPase
MSTENKPVRKSLQEQLEEERLNRGITPPPKQSEPTVDEQIQIARKKMELDSINSGYESFKVRENSINGKITELEKQEKKLAESIGVFELEQKKRLDTYNANIENYNQAYALLQTRSKEAEKIMEQALKKSAEAERILKSQSKLEKEQQEKLEAYQTNMTEVVELLGDVAKVLRREEDSKILSVAAFLIHDFNSIGVLIDRKCSLITVADIVALDCEKITELCGYLQDSKKDRLLPYLLQSVEFIQSSLKIAWTPPDTESVLD